MTKTFRSAGAFKTSLEAHIRMQAAERGVPFQTLQLKFVMERLLARLFHEPDAPWLLKGGFAMDLRFRPRARTTKDIDLSVSLVSTGLSAGLRDRLQTAAEINLGDFLIFRIGEPKTELTNAPKGGGRFPCEAMILGKTYAKFHIDVGLGDAVFGEPERLTGDDILGFAGIEPAVALAIPRPQQFAEVGLPRSVRHTRRVLEQQLARRVIDAISLLSRPTYGIGASLPVFIPAPSAILHVRQVYGSPFVLDRKGKPEFIIRSPWA